VDAGRDMALIYLDREVNWSQFVKPVCLANDPSSSFADKTATVVGWGTQTEDTSEKLKATVLQKVDIPIISNSKCQEWYEKASTFNIMYEGFVTYGGMAGRDMNALAVGLDEVTTNDFLDTRINQVQYLGNKLIEYGIPIQHPVGGHAVFVDAKKFLPYVPKEEFIAQTLAIILYLEAGVRGVEVGTLLADRDPETRDNRYPKLEFLRLAIPRRTYTNNHMDVVAAGLKNIYDIRNEIRSGLIIKKEAPIMRHFTVSLEKA